MGLKRSPTKPTISGMVPTDRRTTIPNDSGPISACFDDAPKLVNCEIAQPTCTSRPWSVFGFGPVPDGTRPKPMEHVMSFVVGCGPAAFRKPATEQKNNKLIECWFRLGTHGAHLDTMPKSARRNSVRRKQHETSTQSITCKIRSGCACSRTERCKPKQTKANDKQGNTKTEQTRFRCFSQLQGQEGNQFVRVP